mgnify:CR=1 FL=1
MMGLLDPFQLIFCVIFHAFQRVFLLAGKIGCWAIG